MKVVNIAVRKVYLREDNQRNNKLSTLQKQIISRLYHWSISPPMLFHYYKLSNAR